MAALMGALEHFGLIARVDRFLRGRLAAAPQANADA